MPGALAQHYEQCGGTAWLMGKPAAAIYEIALRDLDLAPRDVLAIGDSIEHDVAGAHAAGIDALFITSGIHATAFEGAEGDEPAVNGQRVQAWVRSEFGEGLVPRYASERLRW